MEEHYIMVRAVVGANWETKAKARSQICLARSLISSFGSRVEQMRDIPLLTTMVNLHCIHFLQESFTDTPPASLEMVWH